jgi:IclR family transcriptional regulator, acetate operon repressor
MTAAGPAGIEGAETARRAGRLLEIVATAGRPAPLEWIGAQAGLSKSTTYRLLRALQDEGWLERAGRAGYQVGGRLIRLAAAIDPGRDIAERARPWLESLAALTAETASLNLRDGPWAVSVAGAESNRHALHRAVQVGHRTPLGRGCTGLAIMAWLPAAEQERVTRELAADAHLSPADVAGLGRRLSAIVRDGFVRSAEENHPGLAAVAAPVFIGPRGPVVGSIAIGGPVGRWTRAAIDASVPDLLRACAELSASLAETQAAAAAALAALRNDATA